MGKHRRNVVHNRSIRKISRPPHLLHSDQPITSIDEFISKAQSYADEFDLSSSLRCYNQALQLCRKQSTAESHHPKLIELLQSSSYTLLELGHAEKAKKRLLEVVSLTKEPPYQTLMYLAQLSEGKDSLQYYRQGLDALHRESAQITAHESSTPSTSNHFKSLGRAESNAWCAIAELYMTDLCDESEAQTECKRAFEAAAQVDPTNPQAHLTAADYYTVISDEQAARDAIQTCLNLWWSKLENFLADSARRSEEEARANAAPVDAVGDQQKAAGTVTAKQKIMKGEKSNGNDDEEIQLDMEELTGINSSGLLSLARLMIRWEMWEKCATLLEALLEEDEDNVEIHYLLTEVGRHLWKEEDPQLLRYYALQTKIMAAKLGDLELADDMGNLLSELPEDEEPISNDSDSIPSTDDEQEAE